MNPASRVVPFSFDLSSLVSRSVASFYSHLVTRPTGRALRHGIESRIGEGGHVCLSVLDFTQVVVLDYSCADEAVAKLIKRYQAAERPADAYFVARGLAEQHRDPIEEVLLRHGLALVAEVEGGAWVLLGRTSELERTAWHTVHQRGHASAAEIAVELQGHGEADVARALDALWLQRVLFRLDVSGRYTALTALLPDGMR
jgi:hypothetical protein